MNDLKLEKLWNDIPVGKENALDYSGLMKLWGTTERQTRSLLNKLSYYDNGDDYILIRSASGKGFYKTDEHNTIKMFKQECLNKGKSIFAPIRKINRVLINDAEQFTLENNLRVMRELRGYTQSEVCEFMRKYDTGIDKPMISRFENGVCVPTPYQLLLLARLYDCAPKDLINTDFISF